MQKQFHWKKNLVLIWVTQIASLTGFGFVIPFLPQFIQELGIQDPASVRIWTGLIAAAPALPMAIMAPIWGHIGDLYGRKLMITRALTFGVICMFLMSMTRTVLQVFLLRIAQGTLTGTITASTTLVASTTPATERAKALGFYSTSNFIGISIGPFLGGIISEFFSFAVSFRIGAIFLLLGAIIAIVFVQEPRRKKTTKKEECTKQASSEYDKGLHFGQRFVRTFKTLVSGNIAVVLLLIAALRIARAIIFPFIPLRVQEIYTSLGITRGISATTGIITAAVGVSTALAALFLHRLDKSLSHYMLFLLLFGTATVFCFFISMQDTLLLFAMFIVMTMFFLGGVEPIMQSYISRNTPDHKQGVAFGMQSSVSSIGWFIAPLLGSFVSVRWNIAAVFFTAAIVLLFVTIIISVAFKRKKDHTSHAIID